MSTARIVPAILGLLVTATAAAAHDIGRHLLDASYPLLQVKSPSQHTEITLDTKIFDRYVGVYQLNPNVLMTMSRDGAVFYSQLTGQPKLQIFAESERKFFLKAVDAQLTFDVDAQGSPTQVTLHQNGRDTIARRLTIAEIKTAQAVIDARDAEIAKRAKEQKPPSGTEAALRRMIRELQAGEPNYDLMMPALANATRQQLPQIKAALVQFGAVQSVTFKSVDPQSGADVYSVKFANVSTEWKIILTPDGKTAGILFRPE
jgi:fructose-specific phosphotransferase system component IIB